MNLDININRIMIRLSIMIFIIAVSINSSAQVNNATSLIELKAIKDTTLYGEFDYKNRRYVWKNKKDWDLTDDFIKKPRKQQTNSLLEFLSSIDSLHILNYDNDTINLFQYDGGFLLESSEYNVAKGVGYWSKNEQDFVDDQDTIIYRMKDSLIYRMKDSLPFRVSWLPQYIQNALKGEQIDIITQICERFYQSGIIMDLLGYQYTYKPDFIYYKIIIHNGKIIDRKKIEFKFDDDMYNLLDDIYYEVERLKSEGKVLRPNKIDKRRNGIKNGIGEILDSLYSKAPFYCVLEHNPQILKWEENYVLHLVDSLDIINYDNDTIYYELCCGNNGVGQNRASILTNTKRMNVYESYENVVWDTLSGDYRSYYWGNGSLRDYFHRDRQNKYVLYQFPFAPLNMLLFNLTRNWQMEFNYHSNSFLYDPKVQSFRVIESRDLANKNKYLDNDDMVRLISRIVIEDGKVINTSTQMRIGEFDIVSMS